MVIVRSPTQIRDGLTASAHLREPTALRSHRIAAVSAGRAHSQSAVSNLLISNQVPTRRPPAPSPRLSSHRRPHSKAGSRPKQNARPSRRCALMSVSLATQDRQPAHHCHPVPSSQAPLAVQSPARHSIILNSYFHNQGQSPDDDLRVQLARPPSAPQRPNHTTQNPPR